MLLSLIRMPTIAWYLYAKHWEKFRKEEGSDAYPRVGGKLVRLLPLLRSGCKNPTPLLALQSKYVYIQDIFTSFFTLGKAHGWRTLPKCKARLSYCLITGPLFGNATTLRPYPRQHVIQGSGRLSCSLLTFLKWSTKPYMENTEALSTRTFTFPNTWVIQGPNALKTKRIIKWQRLKISHLHQALRLSGTPLVAQY
jgi:hypothetical protein